MAEISRRKLTMCAVCTVLLVLYMYSTISTVV